MKMKQKVAFVAILVFFSSMFLGVTSVQAKATKTPLSFSFTIPHSPGHPDEKIWFSDGIIHVRNANHVGVASNGLTGVTTYLGNLNAVMDSNGFFVFGNGRGTFTFNGGCGSFEGNLILKIRDYSAFGWFTCHGDGKYDGMLIKGNFALDATTGLFNAECEILDPHGG
ncbi:MAG: hypothetical protein ACXABU_15405 [Candidatus Hodarchaeales archaeon]|jgi:hypothetical protein